MERLRRTSAAAKVLNENRKGYGKVAAEKNRVAQSLPNDLKHLAIAQLSKVISEQTSIAASCSFCSYVSDWGVTDSRVWLPIEALPEYCSDCTSENALSQSSFIDLRYFSDAFDYASPEPAARESDYVAESERITGRRIFGSDEEKKANNNKPAQGVTRVKDLNSSRDVTEFQSIQTCRTHPHRQVDCRAAYICDPCLQEKISIVMHRKHEKFVPVSRHEVVFDGQDVMGWKDPREKTCMICQDLAESRCEGCPLRVCGRCEVFMGRMCKGVLNNLFYHYGGVHLKNDVSTPV